LIFDEVTDKKVAPVFWPTVYFGFVHDDMFAYDGLYGAWLRGNIVKVTHQGAAPGQNHAVYHYVVLYEVCLQCFDTGGWASGRASSL